MAGRIKLSLGELRSATCGFEAVLLSLLHSGVTGQEAGFFQDGAVVLILLQQSSGKTVTDGTSLAGNAAACNGADDIKAASGFNQLQGLADDELQSLQAKVIDRSIKGNPSFRGMGDYPPFSNAAAAG